MRKTGQLFSALLATICFVTQVSMADELPARKAGLWEISMASGGSPARTMKQCTDAASDKAMMESMGGAGKSIGANCSKNELVKEGDGYKVSSDCNFSGSHVVSSGSYTGDFSSAYTASIHATFEPPMMGTKESTTNISARWLGECEAGQVPGDIIMPNGMKMNMNALPKMPGSAAKK